MSVFFNGQLHITPAVMTKVDDSGMVNKNLSVPMNLALIGRADSGEPQVAHRIGSPAEARALFQGGELLKAIEMAFAPSRETGAPRTIIAVRVEPATQAHLVLVPDGGSPVAGACQALAGGVDATLFLKLAADASASDDAYNGYYIKMTSGAGLNETNLIEDYNGTTKVATLRYPWKAAPTAADTYTMEPASLCLETLDYGINANRVKVKVEAGTLTGKKITTSLGTAVVVKDNIGAEYFTLQYTGAEASALVTVTGTSIVVEAGDLAAEAAIHTCDLTVYDTVEKVVDFFDAKADMTAVAGADYLEKATPYALDYVADEACKAAAYAVTADLQAVADYLNSVAEPYLAAHRPNEAGEAPENISYQFLHGGTATAPDTTAWANCFVALQTEDVQCVVPLTSTPAIHAAGDAHCVFMSNASGKERRQIVGGALDDTVPATLATAAKALNSDRTYMVASGIKAYNSAGALTLYAPYMAAAVLGGMICGSDPGTSLTNKTLAVAGLETAYRNPTDTDVLIKGGVIPLVETNEGFKVVQSISTWAVNSNYNRVEMGTGFAVDYTARSVREVVQPLIGKGASPALLAEVISRVENALIELSRPAPMGPGVLVGDETSPPYRAIMAELAGDVVRISFTCSPVVPANYFPIAISVVPYSGVATAA